jgi:hypothetical protein
VLVPIGLGAIAMKTGLVTAIVFAAMHSHRARRLGLQSRAAGTQSTDVM